MTNLFIDGVEVVLPSGFSITVKHENAFFTKNGEYTYDIELSLLVPENAKLYGFLNRLNVTERPATKRKAVLVADNRVYINGTEIITGWTDNTVSIQLVAGNSELNYFIGSDELISTLNMPATNPIVGGSISADYVKKTYPDVDYNLMMVYDSDKKVDKNIWLFNSVDGSLNGTVEPHPNIQDYDYIPQPFLCAFIRELFKALGYTLKFNAIEETQWKWVYLVHCRNTYKWNEMLPGWTVKDFLESVESIFNGTFLLDPKNKTVSFLQNVSFLPKVQYVHLQNVVDEYTVECEEEEDGDATNSTISYKLPDKEYYKLRCLPEIVKNTAKHKTVEPDYFTFFGKAENRVKDTIFYYSAWDCKMIYLSGEPFEMTVEVVDQLAALVRENAVSELEFEFIPAEIVKRKCYTPDSYPDVTFLEFDCYVPSVSGAEEEDTESDETVTDTVYDMVNNLTEKSESKGDVVLAFYYGLNTGSLLSPMPWGFPFAFSDRYMNAGGAPQILPSSFPSFNLTEMDKYFYSNGYKVDRKNPVKITCYDSNVYPASSVFEIFNRRFLAKEIEYTIGPNGRTKAWTGTFYPVDIPDTEVEQRWILSDGKWRDGGVWLDEGRWLDS